MAGASDAAGSACEPYPRTTSSSSTAQAGIGGLFGDALQAERQVDHRVRAAGGQLVVAEVDHEMPGRAQVGVECPLWIERACWTRSARAGRPRSPSTRRRASRRRTARARIPASAGASYGAGHSAGATGSMPSAARTFAVVAVRSAWPRPTNATSDGVSSAAAATRTCSATRSVRRLGQHDDEFGPRVPVEQLHRREGRPAADRCGQVAPADAEHGRDADAGRVEQARHLLRAGARCRDDADRTRAKCVGEAEPEAADNRGAAVRAHHERTARGRRLSLSAIS